MSYTKRSDIPCGVEETVVQLDTGDLVAVSCNSKRVDAGVSYRPRARAIDAQGDPLNWPDGRPIETGFTHNTTVERVEALGQEAVNRECMLAVLGEPVQGLFRWSDILLSGQSIRVSIAAAAVVGPADPGAVL
jgi:hypothetical protein